MKDSSVSNLFPFYQFYAFDNDNLHSFECIKNRIYIPENRNYQKAMKDIDPDIKIKIFVNQETLFKEDLLQVINNSNSSQLSFQILLSRILRLVFNPKIEKIRFEEITSEFITDKRAFVNFLNHRINLTKIEELLEDYSSDPDVEIDSESFLNEIIIYTYKYLFVKLSETIYYYHSPRQKDHKIAMNFKECYDTFMKCSSDIKNKNYTPYDFENKQNYIDSFYNSFKTDDSDYIEKIINELLLFSSHKESKNKLFQIINSNVKINSALTTTKKNRFLFPFFKHIIIVFFYREYLDLSDDDLREKFKKIQHSKK